ncbi:MAG: nitroreductase family protein [Lachnospiraceae bacterium]|nr:nitroreductase family protein [Lachnospiraceae bacterium]
MEVKEALLKRRSVRKYTDEKVSASDTDILLHAAMSGPSACNKRPWEFFVVTDEAVLEKLRSATKFSGITAPMAIIVCGNLSRALPLEMKDYWIQDCSAATENILLSAVDLGLGTVWCGVYPQKRGSERVSEILGLNEEQIPLNIIYVGHPAEEPEPRDWYTDKCIHFI